MGVGAIRSIVQAGAPETMGGRAFRPEQPEEIEPYIGTIALQYHYDKQYGLPRLSSASFYSNGPPLQDFWLGRTVEGEAGLIRKGLKNDRIGDFAITARGVAAAVPVYKGWWDRIGEEHSTGLFVPQGTHKEDSKKLLAKAVFNIINPSQNTENTEYFDIQWESAFALGRAKKRMLEASKARHLSPNNPLPTS